jgi:hypothetical protein
MDGLEISLVVAALLIGATGTFSPCGFSVVETLGPTGHTGGRRTTLAACVAFVPGAVIGGLLTFGSLAAVGELLHGAGGRIAYLLAAGLAVVAAVLEVRGTRIVPQIRRQLPEHWRRLLPMPLVGVLYGVLLGIGFTTFVLSFGVWALAGISFALAKPELGILIGAGFGVGRAIPVVALAPLAGTRAGARATDLMAGSPGVYLGVRRGDAGALAAVALALVFTTSSAGAAQGVATGAADPSASAATNSIVYERAAGGGVLRRGGADFPLPGSEPAIGGPYIAVIEEGVVRLLSSGNLAPVANVDAPNADALAVSETWLVYRAKLGSGGDGIFARSIANPAAPGPYLTLATVGEPAQLSPPSLDGDVLVFAIARPRGSRIVQRLMGTGQTRTLLKSGRELLFNPSVNGEQFAYVATGKRKSKLMVRGRGGRGAGRGVLGMKRRNGLIWSTALTSSAAYATLLYPSATSPGAELVEASLAEGGRKGKKKRKKGKKRR